MKKNIVMIETAENIGSGILYPCDFELKSDREKSYIVFTNKHVLGNLGVNSKPSDDFCKSIILQIYDDNGIIVADKFIKRILIHNSINNENKNNDIAALLICIDERVSITLDTMIYQEELEDRETLYMEGYPGVMINDEVSQKVQLEGVAKNIFPQNNMIGVYQIRDDYHWYNNYNDLKLMEGYSGSPVYIKQEKESFLVGMNQSIADIESGENPFKLVYYIKIVYMLDYLRKKGCIIFRRHKDKSYQIDWIYGLEDKLNSYPNKPTFLLLGGSGAGKSSFAKDFSLNGDKLCSTNDGQTTRTNVIYEYNIFCKQSKVIVHLMSDKEFARRIKQMSNLKLINYCFSEIFGLSNNTRVNNKIDIIRKFYYIVEHILLENKGKRAFLDKIEKIVFINGEIDNDELLSLYEELLTIILVEIPISQIKFICDTNKLEEIFKEYKSKKKYDQYFDTEKEKEVDLLKEIIEKQWPSEQMRGDIKQLLLGRCKDNEFDLKKYQVSCYKIIKNNNNYASMIDNNLEIINSVMDSIEFKNKVFDALFNIEGFFNINEFSFFIDTTEIESIRQNFEFAVSYEKEITKGSGKIKIDLDESIDDYCKELYELLIRNFEQLFEMNKDTMTMEFLLNDLSIDKKEILTMCLQVKNGQSLTGLVKSVNVIDSISNEYALLLKELRISTIKILDTYGLDHVEWKANTKDVLHTIKYQYEKDEKINFEDVGILYIKKLDAGRPDELRNILPYVYEVIPQSPVYCVFSGIDIYYSNNEKQIDELSWSKQYEEICPKSVQYILSEQGKAEIIDNIKCSKERKENFYLVLKNNLVPYCGKKELVSNGFSYYKNNLKYIQKVLSSIIAKEYSSLEIVSIDYVKDILSRETSKQSIIMLLSKVFENASVKTWYHHMTVKANFKRISGSNTQQELGFWRANRQQWNQLFHEAYAKIISRESGDLLNCFSEGKDAIEAALINMENRYLGDEDNLFLSELDDSKKNTFRKIIEDMYKNNVYNNNPFDEKEDIGNWSYEEQKKYVLDVVNFAKGFDLIYDIRDRFVKFFVDSLVEQLQEENNLKTKNLVSVNLFFSDALNKLEAEFVEKYQKKTGDNTRKKLYEMLKYHFENLSQ